MIQLLHYTSVRFILVGLLNTLFGYCVFIMLVWLGLNTILALLCASILGVAFNFKTIGGLVFQNNNPQLVYKFILLYVFLYGINLALLETFNAIFHNVYYSAGFSIILCAFLSFYLNQRFIFKKENANLFPN